MKRVSKNGNEDTVSTSQQRVPAHFAAFFFLCLIISPILVSILRSFDVSRFINGRIILLHHNWSRRHHVLILHVATDRHTRRGRKVSRPSFPAATQCFNFIDGNLSCQSSADPTRVDVLSYDSYCHVNCTRCDCAVGSLPQSLRCYQWQQAIKSGLSGVCCGGRCRCKHCFDRGIEARNRREGGGVCITRSLEAL